jgi:predicted enzyme related to lactoylglutathione lyase
MSYQHGRFTWFECHSSDLERSRVFHSELLGWAIEPMEMADGSTYELIRSGSTGIGGLTTLTPEQGKRSFWLSYLSVANVDETAKRIASAGGATLRKGFDIRGVGRIAVVRDPQGAVLALFKGETGDPEPAEGPGSWWWNELWTSNDRDALAFYKSVFGYTHDSIEMEDGGIYHVLMQGELPRAGLMKSPSAEIPPNWLPYVRVEDCDRISARATTLKGKVLWPPNDIPHVGRATVLADPTGATLAAIAPVR